MTPEDKSAYNKTYHIANREKHKAQKKVYNEAHKVENSAYNKSYSNTHKGERSVRRHMYLYGLSESAYNALMAKGCAVCGSIENLHVDHDHKCCSGSKSNKTCGKCIRGALCSNHNRGLGFFNDNIADLENAITYLKMFEKTLDI